MYFNPDDLSKLLIGPKYTEVNDSMGTVTSIYPFTVRLSGETTSINPVIVSIDKSRLEIGSRVYCQWIRGGLRVISSPDLRIDTAVDTGWLSPSLLNGWQNYNDANNATPWQNAEFRKIGTRIELRGLIVGGAMDSVIFELPSGYRPQSNVNFVAWGSGGAQRITVRPDGTASLEEGNYTGSYLSLDGLHFYVD